MRLWVIEQMQMEVSIGDIAKTAKLKVTYLEEIAKEINRLKGHSAKITDEGNLHVDRVTLKSWWFDVSEQQERSGVNRWNTKGRGRYDLKMISTVQMHGTHGLNTKRFPGKKDGTIDFAKAAEYLIDEAAMRLRQANQETTKAKNERITNKLRNDYKTQYGEASYDSTYDQLRFVPSEHEDGKMRIIFTGAVDEKTAREIADFLIAKGVYKPRD